MGISINGRSFSVSENGTVKQDGFDVPVHEQAFFGVVGGYTLIGQPTYRNLSVSAWYGGYGTRAALDRDLTLLAERIGEFGDLEIDESTWPNCRFVSFNLSEPAHSPVEGRNQWWSAGTIAFRQQAARPVAEPVP